jgi:hypothetical protein
MKMPGSRASPGPDMRVFLPVGRGLFALSSIVITGLVPVILTERKMRLVFARA